MKSFRIEDHNAVALLTRLRSGLMETSSRKRKAIFNGLRDAMKGLGLVEAKEPIKGIYEGIDSGGGHWFLCETDDRLAEPGVEQEPPTPAISKTIEQMDEALRAADRQIEKLAAGRDQITAAAFSLSIAMGSPALKGSISDPPGMAVILEATRRLSGIPAAESGRMATDSTVTALHNLTLSARQVLNTSSDKEIHNQLVFQVQCAEGELSNITSRFYHGNKEHV